MNTINFISHNQPLESSKTLKILHKLSQNQPLLVWLVDNEKKAQELINWIWQQDNWIVADTLPLCKGGIALAWPGLKLPAQTPILNSSSLSLESTRNAQRHELVHINNKVEMRKRYKFYQQLGLSLTFEKSD